MVSFSLNTTVPGSILGCIYKIKKQNNAGINTFKSILTMKLFFLSPCLVVKPRKRLEHSGTREKHSTTSRVSPYTSFVPWPLPTCFTTEQS